MQEPNEDKQLSSWAARLFATWAVPLFTSALVAFVLAGFSLVDRITRAESKLSNVEEALHKADSIREKLDTRLRTLEQDHARLMGRGMK